MKQRITPFLWFDGNAEEAVKFYTSIFKKSKIRQVSRYPKAAANATGRTAGSLMTIVFELDGQKFMAMNGGSGHKFNDAISLMVHCKDQKELDYYWKKLSAGGEEVVCGWLKDKYGVSWQVVPKAIGKWISSKDPARTQRVMEQVMKLTKLDFKKLKHAYAGKKK
jgi:predicted 3-demethylubiquinone-9 3-methyltransferase (glyoxalase superfamily)